MTLSLRCRLGGGGGGDGDRNISRLHVGDRVSSLAVMSMSRSVTPEIGELWMTDTPSGPLCGAREAQPIDRITTDDS